MSDTKVKSYLPITLPVSSDDESKKSGNVMEKVSISTISPMPTRKALGSGKLIPAPERLTPTGQGRIKLPPVCIAPAMKKVASNDFDFISLGVCFTLEEAELCAEKALILGGINLDTAGRDPASSDDEEEPLNIDKCLGFSCTTSDESLVVIATIPPSKSEVTKCVSSSSSIVSTSSCGRTAMRDTPTVVVTTSVNAMKDHPPSTLLTNNNLTKSGNTSRQGRSLQRWLVHSPSNELVRQVAGTIPITKDGRIILISASRKKEWILPKGGWDTDESKEECALRETFEEGGLVGKLGGRLEPIDYESGKSKKRALKEAMKELTTSTGESSMEIMKGGSEVVKGQISSQDHEESTRPSRPPCPKRFKAEFSSSSTGPELLMASVTKSNSSESTSSSSTASDASCTTTEPYYSYIRLNLFPLYVSSVESEWPEKGRLRKLVHIDEAIRIMDAENRPYFRMGLELVKERGLHLLMKSEESKE